MENPIYHLDKVVRVRQEEMEDFDGPLDLILHLLSKNKMEIQDIRISELVDQYMQWMDQRRQMDMEVASDFVAMAAHLIYIKTRMLLSIRDEEAMSEMEELIASLEEHKRHADYEKVRTVLPEFEQRFEYGRDYLTREPEPVSPVRTYTRTHPSSDLSDAMLGLNQRISGRVPPTASAFHEIVGREPYPVTRKAEEIIRKLKRSGVRRFRSLFRSNHSRSEVVATFIAVLELCKAHRLKLSGPDDDCTVSCSDGVGKIPVSEFSDS